MLITMVLLLLLLLMIIIIIIIIIIIVIIMIVIIIITELHMRTELCRLFSYNQLSCGRVERAINSVVP